MRIIKQAHQLILTLIIFFTFSGLHAQGWNDYISYLKTDENVIETAFIFGLDGSVWASSSRAVSNKDIVNYLNTKGASAQSSASCLKVNGECYVSVRFDSNTKVGYLKKNKGGACIAVTNQTIIFGSWNSNLKQANGQTQNAASANARVEALQKLLKDANY